MINVPESELRPEYIPLPNGQYDGDFDGAELTGNDSGWEAIAASFSNMATADGSTEVSPAFKGRDVTMQLGSRVKTVRYTTATPKSAKAVEIGLGEIARLGLALGVAHTNGDGRVTMDGETAAELVETLNAARGTRVRFSIKQEPRKRSGEVVLGDDSQPIIDDNVKRVWQSTQA